MNDYYWSTHVASRLAELRAEAAHERLASQVARRRRREWLTVLGTVAERWPQARRRESAGCCTIGGVS